MSDRPLNIGITCFPTFGGSGLVASEIGLEMAARGHRVHVIARELPVRLSNTGSTVGFHEVRESQYPALAGSSAYPIALASRMIEVATRENLDVLHVHYAVPHATAAWMACEVMGERAPRIVTTLHGTDITLVGSDPNHLPITRYSIERSDAVTTPSQFLKRATASVLGVTSDQAIEVISNFVDTDRFAPSRDRGALREIFHALGDDEPVLVHVSNLRAVKRIDVVVDVFAAVNASLPSRLLVIGDGPERHSAERRVKELGLTDRVAFVGAHERFEPLLAASDVFVLPSEQESFGLAALEAMSCGVPVVATDVGGLPELIEHGQTGFLTSPGDVATMAAHVLELAKKPAQRTAFATRARERVLQRYRRGPAIDSYEALYRRVTSSPSTRRAPSRSRL